MPTEQLVFGGHGQRASRDRAGAGQKQREEAREISNGHGSVRHRSIFIQGPAVIGQPSSSQIRSAMRR